MNDRPCPCGTHAGPHRLTELYGGLVRLPWPMTLVQMWVYLILPFVGAYLLAWAVAAGTSALDVASPQRTVLTVTTFLAAGCLLRLPAMRLARAIDPERDR